MTELEHKAAEAWSLMYAHAMPARIALDFVQDVTGEREEAFKALLAAATCATANARPSVVQKETAGSFPDFEAGKIGAAMLRGDWDFGGTILANLRGRLRYQELNPTTSVTHIAEWIAWCDDVQRAIALCRELSEAA